uniref:Uncharacterized protein n=1 Tax=Oryza glumipatula TaxID=40148 RepID=A0A0E0AD88_9ORYZ
MKNAAVKSNDSDAIELKCLHDDKDILGRKWLIPPVAAGFRIGGLSLGLVYLGIFEPVSTPWCSWSLGSCGREWNYRVFDSALSSVFVVLEYILSEGPTTSPGQLVSREESDEDQRGVCCNLSKRRTTMPRWASALSLPGMGRNEV